MHWLFWFFYYNFCGICSHLIWKCMWSNFYFLKVFLFIKFNLEACHNYTIRANEFAFSRNIHVIERLFFKCSDGAAACRGLDESFCWWSVIWSSWRDGETKLRSVKRGKERKVLIETKCCQLVIWSKWHQIIPT